MLNTYASGDTPTEFLEYAKKSGIDFIEVK